MKIVEKIHKILRKQSDKCDPNGHWRWPSIVYTLDHKIAFLQVEYQLFQGNSFQGLFHDWEKPFLYLNPWMTKKQIRDYHRQHSAHHVGSKKLKRVDHLIEMYIDWECARITKPDKPLNAFETLVHFYPEMINYMVPVCMALNYRQVLPTITMSRNNELYTSDFHNQEVYEFVQKAILQIFETFPDVIPPLRMYRHKDIFEMKPGEIYVQVVLEKYHALRLVIDRNDLKQELFAVSEKLRVHKKFEALNLI